MNLIQSIEDQADDVEKIVQTIYRNGVFDQDKLRASLRAIKSLKEDIERLKRETN